MAAAERCQVINLSFIGPTSLLGSSSVTLYEMSSLDFLTAAQD